MSVCLRMYAVSIVQLGFAGTKQRYVLDNVNVQADRSDTRYSYLAWLKPCRNLRASSVDAAHFPKRRAVCKNGWSSIARNTE